MEGNSIIRDWSKLRNWELDLLEGKGYEEAIIEKALRARNTLVYQMPDGMWAATAMGVATNGFLSEKDAQTWVENQFIQWAQRLGHPISR